MQMQPVNHFCAPVLQLLSLLTGYRIVVDDAAGFAAYTGMVCTFLLAGLMAAGSCFAGCAGSQSVAVRRTRALYAVYGGRHARG